MADARNSADKSPTSRRADGDGTTRRLAASTTSDEQILHKLGYAQELFRAMGGFQNFAISFTIISILAGLSDLVLHRVPVGRPGRSDVGLAPGRRLLTIIVALAMAEIASTYPTAGGLYYWASKLGSPAWGWLTGWFNLIGQIAVTAAIGYGLATFATSLFDLWFGYPNTNDSSGSYVVYTVRDLLAGGGVW